MKQITEQCVEWIRAWMDQNGGKTAVLGISGGKDSTVTAALCCRALGAGNVVGVMMPNGEQKDIADSYKVCELLGIRMHVVDISKAYQSLLDRVSFSAADGTRLIPSKQTRINLAPRLRMATLYALAQSLEGGRVVNTSNRDEALVGYCTLWGDDVGDFSPLGMLHVSQVIDIGRDLGVPEELLVKPPSDGLTGKTDEEALGFSYADVEELDTMHDDMLETYDNPEEQLTGKLKAVWDRHQAISWKLCMANLPVFEPYELENDEN